MKKILNKVENVVAEMLDGIVYSNNKVYKVDGYNVIARKESKDKVVLISGGGSGHEPAHAGFVGYGMLDAAVAGEVFTSPAVDQVYGAIEAVDKGKGVLLVIKNYTGDVMNFEMAAEMANANGSNVKSVIVNDDIAVEDSLYTAGRRGVAGTVFVHKIAGSAAEDGKSLDEVVALAEKVVANTKTLGMSLGGATVPASGKKSFELAEDEIEMGLGIHGEPGTHKEKLNTAHEHVKYMLDLLLKESNIKDEKVAVLVNGLGSTTLMELYIVNKEVNDQLKLKGVKVHKSLVGNYMTSLEMPGFSITLLKLDDEMEKYLDYKIESTLF
ncbi:dihydroxyacetone kinase subunit DhaK [Mycoplasmopsis columboralis]|uniref:Dihydroxyacetone kinase subunit DhaK n=1 Tax=Mycoplasmopsis columboralis TaxID=171282 RepID=A0A449B681_9BACT|nr:dihydroxyacetone kinase subunit DhaK [Mycoplasmopsis columboralis]VEU76065.1 dihydroxyacetone kinase subunit DhaK [Mycoplasmopsis columboralis]